MITEAFVNSCFSLVLNRNTKIRKTKALYRDILEVLNFTEKKESIEIPLMLKGKVDCIKKIIEMLLYDKPLDAIIDSISFSDKFNQYRDFLEVKISEVLKDSEVLALIKQVTLRKKMSALFKNYDQLNNVLDKIKDGTFDAIDDLIEDYEMTIRQLYTNMMDCNRELTIQASASLDLVKDDFKHVLDMVVKKYGESNATPTGFGVLDTLVTRGGFEPSRLYVFCGSSGSGKSTIMNNFIYRAAQKGVDKKGGEKNVFIYVTLENTIEEALMRTYMPMFGKDIKSMLRDITQGVDIKSLVKNKLEETNSVIIMKYFPAMSISTIDLAGVLDDVANEYGKESICGLYVDYLDLLRTDTRYDLYRLELGHITLSLKTLAVEYNVPVITASQLGRGAYKISNSSDLSVDMVTESIKKVEHADFIMLLAKDPVNDGIVHARVGKNRSGKAGIAIDFKVRFEEYKFIEAVTKAAVEKDSSDILRMDCTREGDARLVKSKSSEFGCGNTV
jgi:replicative DNA helicase